MARKKRFATETPENVCVKKVLEASVATSACLAFLGIQTVDLAIVARPEVRPTSAMRLESVLVCLISLAEYATNAVLDITTIRNVYVS